MSVPRNRRRRADVARVRRARVDPAAPSYYTLSYKRIVAIESGAVSTRTPAPGNLAATAKVPVLGGGDRPYGEPTVVRPLLAGDFACPRWHS